MALLPAGFNLAISAANRGRTKRERRRAQRRNAEERGLVDVGCVGAEQVAQSFNLREDKILVSGMGDRHELAASFARVLRNQGVCHGWVRFGAGGGSYDPLVGCADPDAAARIIARAAEAFHGGPEACGRRGGAGEEIVRAFAYAVFRVALVQRKPLSLSLLQAAATQPGSVFDNLAQLECRGIMTADEADNLQAALMASPEDLAPFTSFARNLRCGAAMGDGPQAFMMASPGGFSPPASFASSLRYGAAMGTSVLASTSPTLNESSAPYADGPYVSGMQDDGPYAAGSHATGTYAIRSYAAGAYASGMDAAGSRAGGPYAAGPCIELNSFDRAGASLLFAELETLRRAGLRFVLILEDPPRECASALARFMDLPGAWCIICPDATHLLDGMGMSGTGAGIGQSTPTSWMFSLADGVMLYGPHANPSAAVLSGELSAVYDHVDVQITRGGTGGFQGRLGYSHQANDGLTYASRKESVVSASDIHALKPDRFLLFPANDSSTYTGCIIPGA